MFASLRSRSSVVVRASRVSHEVRCALCRADSDESPIRCEPCGVVVHATCGQELASGHCPTIGCRAPLSSAVAVALSTAARDDSDEATADEPGASASRPSSWLVAGVLALGALVLPTDLRLYDVEGLRLLALDLVGAVSSGLAAPSPPVAAPARTTPPTPAPEESPRAAPERHWELPVAPRPTGPVPLFSSSDPVSSQPTRWAPAAPAPPAPPARPKRPSWAPSLGD